MRNFNDYRAQTKEFGLWVYGTPIKRYGHFYVITKYEMNFDLCNNASTGTIKVTEVDERTIGQYIGMNLDLYEGDVITDGKVNVVLLWDEGNARFETFSTDNLKKLVFVNQPWADLHYVGNIWDNPELLT